MSSLVTRVLVALTLVFAIALPLKALTVELSTSVMPPGSTYTVTVSNVRDRSNAHNSIVSGSQASFAVNAIVKLTGVVFGSGDPYGGSTANGYRSAVDGSASTYADCTGSLVMIGYDLGELSRYVVTSIRYMPRSGWTDRMIGMRVQVSTNNSNWTTVYTIGAAPAQGVFTSDIIALQVPNFGTELIYLT